MLMELTSGGGRNSAGRRLTDVRVLVYRGVHCTEASTIRRPPMDHAAFKTWLDRYVDAWRLSDPIAIGDLFSADVRYAFDPFRRPLLGARRWSQPGWWIPTTPGSWQADYEVLAIDGDTLVAHGRTRYLTDDRSGVDREFANVFVCRFDADGRCREFTEWYMRRRPEAMPD